MANNGLLSPFIPKRIVRKYSNLDKDFSLSLSDMGTTVAIDSPNGFNVKLPDCRQLKNNVSVGIMNVSSVSLGVLDNAGTLLKTLASKQSTSAGCIVKTTSAGTWVLT